MNSAHEVLGLTDSRAQQALRTGWLENKNEVKKRVIARQTIDNDGQTEVVFEKIDPPVKPGIFQLWFHTTRAFSLTATATPCIAILAFFLLQGVPINLPLAMSSLFGVLLLQVSINIFNDIGDYYRLIDLPGTLGGSGAIQKGWWTPAQLRKIAWASLFLGSALGLPAVTHYPSELILIAIAAGLGVLRYSARVFGLKYWALGDLAVWILCGPALTTGFSVATSGSVNLSTLWIGSFFGWLAVGILHANNLHDINIDKKRSVRTLAIALGFKNSMRFLFAIYILAAASLIPAGVLTANLWPYALSASVTLLISVPWLLKIRNALGPDSAVLVNCRFKAAQIHLLSGLILIAFILLNHFLA
jgi:1,4-dihydroxy-2-naphthoate octaprenyltransferase